MDQSQVNGFKSRSGLQRIVRALGYSLNGLRAALAHEHAFRQELTLAAILIPVALILPVSGLSKAMLVGSVILVLIVELLNSAIETAVDRISLEAHALAKRAKDLGSAAVFLSLVNVVVVWALVIFA